MASPFGFSQIKWNEAELRLQLRGRSGMVGHDLQRLTLRIRNAAVRRASGDPHGYYKGRLYPSAPGSGPGVRTNRLRGSITNKVRESSGGLEGLVGTNVYYAIYLERAKNPNRRYPFLEPAFAEFGLRVHWLE